MPEDTLTSPTENLSQESPASLPVSGPRDAERAALYEKHYGSTPPPTEQNPSEAAAQAPPATEVPAPLVASLPPEFLTLMQSMQTELTELRTQLKPAAPPPTETPEASWVALIREGKFEEAEIAMADAIAKRNNPLTVQQAVTQAREIGRAEAEVDRYVTELRTQNPELLPMESWIASEAQKLMAVAQQSGKIKSTDDAIQSYKTSVSEAVSSARKLYQRIRGDGKQEANTRNREVLSSLPIPPQTVDNTRSQNTSEGQEPPQESVQDYLQKRSDAANKRKGLA